jgi:hypothetical protein
MRDQARADTGPDGSDPEPSSIGSGIMSDHNRITITDAEVLAVSGGMDDATGQPVVVLTLRPITGSCWRSVNYSLHPDNARSLLDRLTCVVIEAERG